MYQSPYVAHSKFTWLYDCWKSNDVGKKWGRGNVGVNVRVDINDRALNIDVDDIFDIDNVDDMDNVHEFIIWAGNVGVNDTDDRD